MTKEQAVKIAQSFWGGSASSAVDTLVALGMLKLDEPKSEDVRLAEALGTSFAFDTNKDKMTIFRAQLALRGLKIVEK